MKPLRRYELLRQQKVTLPHPEHEDLAKEFLDRKEQRRLRVKALFHGSFPDLAADFIHLAEQCYTLNAPYQLDKILDLLSVYDYQAVATALRTALELGTPAVGIVQTLLPEKLKQPDFPTSFRTASLPAVSKRSLSLYRVSYGGSAL